MTWERIERGLRKYKGKRGTSYQVLLRVQDGIVSETFSMEKDARKRLDELRGKREGGSLNYKNIRLGIFCDKWLERQKIRGIRGSSITEYNYCLSVIRKYFNPTIQLKRISVPLIRDFETYLANELKLSGNKSGQIFSILKRILTEAREEGYNVIIPPARRNFRNNRGTEEAIPLEPLELDLLLEHAGFYGKAYQDIFRFISFTGCRVSEVLALRFEDIDFLNRKIHINQAWYKGMVGSPKSRASKRSIPIFSHILPMLRERKKEAAEFYLKHPQHKDLDLVFPSTNGNYRSAGTINRIFKRSLRKADLPQDFSPHSLRHTFCSWLFSMTENILYISKVLGHSNPAITLKVYSHLLKRDDEEITRSINDRFATFFNKQVIKSANR